MLEFGLKGKDKVQLEGLKNYYTGWGRGADYCHLYVYDMEDNLLIDDILRPDDFNIKDEGIVDFDAGKHLRELGYDDGTYKVQYLFLRKDKKYPEFHIFIKPISKVLLIYLW